MTEPVLFPEALEAITVALMRDRHLLTWRARRPLRLWSGKYLPALNWDYRQMARTAYDAVEGYIRCAEPVDLIPQEPACEHKWISESMTGIAVCMRCGIDQPQEPAE